MAANIVFFIVVMFRVSDVHAHCAGSAGLLCGRQAVGRDAGRGVGGVENTVDDPAVYGQQASHDTRSAVGRCVGHDFFGPQGRLLVRAGSWAWPASRCRRPSAKSSAA
jgi:hypothetical protein